jgi:GR25 family glycosyltransferase involved in LPS biosynthesis
MRIGVTVHFQYSFFSAGSPQTCFAIAETYRTKGHDVFLINVGTSEWWDDVKVLKEDWKVVQHGDAFSCDLVIEVGACLLTVEERRSHTSVWLCRKPLIFSDIESSLFPVTNPRNLEGISEVWLISQHTTPDDIQYAQLLFRKPVKLLPFTWSPTPIEAHRREVSAPVWQQVSHNKDLKQEWSVHICETNTTASSSSIVPLMIMREVKRKTETVLHPVVKIHNSETVKTKEFFRYNTLNHVFSDIQDMSGSIIGRQRVIDYVYDPMSIVIAHSRFLNLRPYLFDCLWAGIPLVHNSKHIASLGPYHALGFYTDNQISEGRDAFLKVTAVAKDYSIEALVETRKKIMEIYSPLSSAIQDAWNTAAMTVTAEVKVDVKVPEVAAKVPETSTDKPVIVAFSDMWDGFNPEYNMFTLMLEASTKRKIIVDSKNPDVLIFGPFGSDWTKFSCPKIHYTGENTEPVLRDDIKLNIGYKHGNFNNRSYLRVPLWMLEIDWFHADVNRIANPKPIPIHACCNPNKSDRSKFCAFVVTNPRQPMRNSAFDWLSKYKQVDSAGRLFNNIGSDIFAGLGGGGGELMKYEFLKQYKFCLTYENASSPGYLTEKVLHAKAAGCIPIYWGDSKFERDFDLGGVIDARNVKTAEELIECVKEVDENPELYEKMRSIPCLDEVRRDSVRRTLAECARRILAAAGVSEEVPDMIGFTEDLPLPLPSSSSTILVTACNAKFLPSLEIWLSSTLKVADSQSIVYLMSDISEGLAKEYSTKYKTVDFRRFPSEGLADFADLWAPEHFAWKVWILQELCVSATAGTSVLYMDTGATLVRWPVDWMNAVRTYGVCVLYDDREFNKYRCHQEFIKATEMTAEELAANQIWAGSIAFVAGHPLASKYFNEAWKWAQKRKVIAGPKWTGEIIDGHYFGHRHDQSILSLLAKRLRIPTLPLDSVYCHTSMRHTNLLGRSMYVHRGLFKLHEPYAQGIDDVWVINLDRRKDRLESFTKLHGFGDRLMRLSAFDGKKLTMTPKLARLFAPNDFNWKKSVMGCALSHLALWMQLFNEKPNIQSYLILEDDARLQPGWKMAWEKAMEEGLMADHDLVYLGGILPPNKAGFDTCIEKVSDHVGKIRTNTLFTQTPSTYFHFCAYSYVLTRKGAEKILAVLKARNGYWTSADHMMCNIQDVLKIYFLNPLVAGCYQDNDPKYQESAFNDFSRVDSFDSDLWNNTEKFEGVVADMSREIDIIGALEDGRLDEIKPVILPSLGKRLVSVRGCDLSKWHEYEWLKMLFNDKVALTVETLDLDSKPTDEPILIVQRPLDETRKLLDSWKENVKFYVLHMSDEFGTDPIDFYEWPGCLGVIRNYSRPGLPEKAKVIPLGFHWNVPKCIPLSHTPRPPFREFLWSFVGTEWKGRKEKLLPLMKLHEHKCVFMDDWNSPKMLGREENLAILLNSWFVPCPGGQNAETFRFYEALEAGCVPILVKDDVYTHIPSLPLLLADNWDHAASILRAIQQKPEVYEELRKTILDAWETLKKETIGVVAKTFGL